MGRPFFCLHSDPVFGCCLWHSVKRKVELERHYDGRRKPGRGDVWLFQRTRAGAIVRVRNALVRDNKAPVRWCNQDMAGLRRHVGTALSVQSVTFWRANKAALG